MNIQVTSRHAKVSPETQDYLKGELQNLEKFYDKISSAHVILDSEHLMKTVEISMTVQGSIINATAKEENLGKAVDEVMEKIKRQLKKMNEKVKNHKNTGLKESVQTIGAAE